MHFLKLEVKTSLHNYLTAGERQIIQVVPVAQVLRHQQWLDKGMTSSTYPIVSVVFLVAGFCLTHICYLCEGLTSTAVPNIFNLIFFGFKLCVEQFTAIQPNSSFNRNLNRKCVMYKF